MSALPNEPITPRPVAVVTPPPEMLESEDLVVRQANALVIASEDDYAEAGKFLNSVIVAGKKKVFEFFDPHVRRAHEAHIALTSDRAKHLAPWEKAEAIVKNARVLFFRQQKEREESERRERERAARALEDERQRQEAEGERRRAAEEAARILAEAEQRRINAEAEAERQRNRAEEASNAAAREAAQKRARDIEEQATREALAAEETAAEIAAAGEATAHAIETAPVHLALPSQATGKLKGVAEVWGVNKDEWNPVAFAKWIAADPEGRAKYIGAPAWPLLTAEAKQQKSKFDVGGIIAGPKYSGRAGRS